MLARVVSAGSGDRSTAQTVQHEPTEQQPKDF